MNFIWDNNYTMVMWEWELKLTTTKLNYRRILLWETRRYTRAAKTSSSLQDLNCTEHVTTLIMSHRRRKTYLHPTFFWHRKNDRGQTSPSRCGTIDVPNSFMESAQYTWRFCQFPAFPTERSTWQARHYAIDRHGADTNRSYTEEVFF